MIEYPGYHICGVSYHRDTLITFNYTRRELTSIFYIKPYSHVILENKIVDVHLVYNCTLADVFMLLLICFNRYRATGECNEEQLCQ